jgi:hypothetical protein
MPQTPEERAARARARREGGRRPIGRVTIPQAPPPDVEMAEDPTEPGVFGKYGPTLVRGLSSLVPGLAWGSAAGGAGEGIAQKIEIATGQRQDYDPTMIVTEAALGAVPFARLGKILGFGGKALGNVAAGAAAGGVGTLGRQQASEGLHVPSAEDVREAVGSAAVGGGAAGVLGGLVSAVAGRKPTPRLEVDRFSPNVPSDGAAGSGVQSSRVPYRGQVADVPGPDPRIDPYAPNTPNPRAGAVEYGPELPHAERGVDPYAPNTPGGESARHWNAPGDANDLRFATEPEFTVDRFSPNVPNPDAGAFADLGPQAPRSRVLTGSDQYHAADPTGIEAPELPGRVPYRPNDDAPLSRTLGRLQPRSEPTLDEALQDALAATRRADPVQRVSMPPETEVVPRSGTASGAESVARRAEQDAAARRFEVDRAGEPVTTPAVGAEDVPDAVSASPFSASFLNPRRLLPGIGETSETNVPGNPQGRLLSDRRTIDLAQDWLSERVPGTRVKSLNALPAPEGDDFTSRALRQRKHIDESMRRRRQKVNPESGFANPEILADVAAGGVGAATGAALDEDNRLRGALLGGGAGLLSGRGLMRRGRAGLADQTGSVGPDIHRVDPNADVPGFELVDDVAPRLNASGESAASAEALSRQRGMQTRGERFVVIDRSGRRRPLLGPDAVDYRPQPGETYGVEEAGGGFRILDRGDLPTSGRLSSETGALDPELAVGMGTTLGGAALGAATDEENRTRGALLGAAGGAGLAAGVKNPRLLERLRFFSMLSSPLTHAKNVAGNIGSLATEAGTKALTGDLSGAGRLLAAPFREGGETVRAFREGYRDPSKGDANRMGVDWDVDSLLSVPGRIISGVDSASRNILERGGLDANRAAKATFGNEPELPLSQWLLSGHRRLPALRQFVPFAKTPLNIAERGLEHSPLAPLLPSAREALVGGGQARREAIARMALGTGAAGAAYATGADDPMTIAAAGPLALPVALGGFTGAADTPESSTDSAIERGLRQAARMVPGLTPQIPGTQEYFASYVPNAARDLAEFLDPADEREAPGYFGETARRVPILRETLPEKSSGRRRTRRSNRNRVTR